ncbi:MAG: hypothetical protein D6797_04915 [Bdellovibrio sp.]|nr:MAG: hypothetical protein D6797_04915 [Bdellovibrio sp.]
MKRHLWLKGLLLLFSMLLLQACGKPKKEEPCGFVMNSLGQRVSWSDGKTIYLYVHDSVPVELEPGITAAVAEINRSLKKTRIEIIKGLQGKNQPAQDGYSVIYFKNEWDANRPDEQARTTIYWKGTHIYEADIMVNGKNFQFFVDPSELQKSGNYRAIHFKSLMLHELGHVLGLAHRHEENTVMAETLLGGEIRDWLTDSDKKSLRCEYQVNQTGV